jgi:hypothetical protein
MAEGWAGADQPSRKIHLVQEMDMQTDTLSSSLHIMLMAFGQIILVFREIFVIIEFVRL